MDYTAEERVKNSIELLDDVAGKVDFVPVNWREKIDLGDLNMDSCTYCILGQLWKAETGESDGYSDAKDALDRTSPRDVYSGKYTFSDAGSEWIKQLKNSMPAIASKFNPGDEYQDVNKCCTRTVKKTIDIDGETWIAFTFDGVTSVLRESEFTSRWTLKPKVRFTKGQWLKPKVATGYGAQASYIYISEEKVIRILNNKMSWCSLKWYENSDGELIVDESRGNAKFYMEMWNES
jgi:hypothetical protein